MFFSSKKKSNALQGSYPNRKYIQVMCTRKHCTEACDNKDDQYKFWALLLAGSEVNQEDIIKYIKNIPEKLRFATYLRLVGNIKVLKNNDYTNYLKASSNIKKSLLRLNKTKPPSISEIEESSYVEPTGKYIKLAIERDKILLDKIFRFCEKYNLPNSEESVFNIYKQLGKSYKVNEEIIKLICDIKTMPYSTTDGIYTLIDHMYQYFGLEEFIEIDESVIITLENNKEIINGLEFNEKNLIVLDSDLDNAIIDKTEEFKSLEQKLDDKDDLINDGQNKEEDSEESFNSSSLEKSIQKNELNYKNEEYEDLFNESASLKETPSKELHNDSSINYKEILKIILKFDFPTFITINDIAFSTNLTYKQLILHAGDFSNSEHTDSVIKVLAARSNFKYYKPVPRKSPVLPERKSASYFDFLLIQNELIKAQENIRSSLMDEITKLKGEILQLKMAQITEEGINQNK